MNKKSLAVFIVINIILFICECFYFYNDFFDKKEKLITSNSSEEVTVLPEIIVIGKKIN